MRRFLKFLLIIIVVVVAALAVNALIVNGETQPATADIGRVIDLPGPDLQVKEASVRRMLRPSFWSIATAAR